MVVQLVPFHYTSPLLIDAVRVYCAVWERDEEDSVIFFRQYAQMPDFTGYIAMIANKAIGIAFGTRSQNGQWWHDKVTKQVGRSHPSLQNAWVLTELAVLEAYRNQKIGHLLHHSVLPEQPYTNALLSTQVDNDGAKRFYEKRGWTYLHSGFAFHKGRPKYCIMHKDLTHEY